MLAVLARENSNSMFEVITTIFSRADTLAHPNELLTAVERMHWGWGVLFLIAGIFCLVQGYKYHRAVTFVLALSIGGFVGYVLGEHVRANMIVAGCFALLAAACCWPLMKYTVAVMGGLVGAFLGANLWSAIASLQKHHSGDIPQADTTSSLHWVGALVGLIIVGMLAFIVFKLSVVFFTSVSGATVALIGALCLLLKVDTFRGDVVSSLSKNAITLPLMVLVPTIIGLILQQAQPDKGGGGGGAPKAAPKPA